MSEIEAGHYQPVSAKLDEYLLGSESRQPVANGIPGFITEQQLARQLGLSLVTVRRWRRQRCGPKSVRIGRRDYYRVTAVEEFAAEQLAAAEAAGKPRTRVRPRVRR